MNMEYSSIFKNFVSWLNQYSNLVLVLITAIYAFLTYRMTAIMKRQIVSNLSIYNFEFGSSLKPRETTPKDEIFKKAVEKIGIDQYVNQRYLRFVFCFDIRNSSPGSGSIFKPELFLRIPNQLYNFKTDYEYSIMPKTTEQVWERNEGNSTVYNSIDLGNTIYLKGGEASKIRIEYFSHTNNHRKKEIYKKFIEALFDREEDLEYYFKYIDNMGKKHKIQINKNNIVNDREI